jgi:hypothetical protein
MGMTTASIRPDDFSRPVSRRSALFAAACFVVGCATTAEPARTPTKVLFVCQYGTVKSAIAREQLRRLAAARTLRVQVTSRGISPEDHISPALAAAVARDGLDIRREPIRTLTANDLSGADVIVVFDTLPAGLGSWPVRDWSDLPSMNADYEHAREILVNRISVLLDELERR